jgi:hypothetical protein
MTGAAVRSRGAPMAAIGVALRNAGPPLPLIDALALLTQNNLLPTQQDERSAIIRSAGGVSCRSRARSPAPIGDCRP